MSLNPLKPSRRLLTKRLGVDTHRKVLSDPAVKQATSELRTLLERFANGRSLGTIGEAMQTLYDYAQQDEELRNWFRSVDTYVRKASILYPFICSWLILYALGLDGARLRPRAKVQR